MHRDLKPANILIARESQTLKLTDFGLAKRFPASSDQAHLVRMHTANIGTPRYTAPEVLEGLDEAEGVCSAAAYTEKADVYSAALIIWFLVTGQRPSCKVRENPRARPDLGPARRRWAELAGLLERMWLHEAGARPSAGECVLVVRGMEVRVPACGVGGGCTAQ